MEVGSGTKKRELGPINFGAFPRSGNHTLGKTLSLAFPDVQPYWLRHRITDLLTAPNCAVVIRNPIESIASWMEGCDDNRPDGVSKNIDWYVRYMNGILKAKDNITVFRLEDLSAQPYECMVEFSNRFDFEKPNFFKIKDVESWLSENMPNHFPRKTSFLKEKRYKEILSHPQYVEALNAYNDVLDIATRIC
jgi:hypothetical protein